MKLGFRCIKVKIGAIDFNKELELLEHIRQHFSPEQIELRVDANGAFSPADAPSNWKAYMHSTYTPSNNLFVQVNGKKWRHYANNLLFQ